MSKRRDNCEHTTWMVLPGNHIQCSACGEAIDQSEISDWLHHNEPVSIQVPDQH